MENNNKDEDFYFKSEIKGFPVVNELLIVASENNVHVRVVRRLLVLAFHEF